MGFLDDVRDAELPKDATYTRRLRHDDGFATIRAKEHTAHKVHEPCWECLGKIFPGQRYVVWVGHVDYQFSISKRHAHACKG